MFKVTVFCSANNDIDQYQKDNAYNLGQLLGGMKTVKLVTGGGDTGLMKEVAKGFMELGDKRNYLGITVAGLDNPIEGLPHVNAMSIGDRYDLYFNNADMIIALPGGHGTVGELLTAVTNRQLFHNPYGIYIYDPEGSFAEVLLGLEDDLYNLHTLYSYADVFSVIRSLQDMKELIKYQANDETTI